MKQITLFVFLLCAHFIALSQVTGLKNVPGDYATLELAIADLNTVGVGPGGATINILPGNPQTAPVNGYQLGSGVLNPTLLAANPLIINGNGNTATANTGVGLYDAIFILKGADYVTIDGLNLIENGANVNSTMWMEWGYALLKRQNVAPFDGCQNNIIQNCNITLNRAHGSLGYGIYANNHIPLTNTQLTLSSINDANSFNTFRANTIQNVNSGILLQGSTNALYYDLNNIVGGTNGANGNIIQNFGNNAAIITYGIYTFYQNNLLIQNNNLNNMNGGGVAPTTTQYGIYTSTATFSGFYTIRKNTVNLTQGSTGIVYGIYNTASNTNNLNTINIDSNDVAFTHITTGSTVYGIYNSGSCANLNLNANKMNNISTPGTGTMYLFYIAGTVYTSEVVNDNKITNFTRTGASGTTYGIYFPGPGVGNANVTASFQRNKIDRMFYSNAANAGAMYSIYAYRAACVKTVKNDTVINCRNNAGTRYGFYTYNYNTGSEVSNNFIANDTSSGAQFGLYLASSTYTNTAVSDNIITGFYNAGTTTSMYGLYCTGGTNLNIHRNNIHNMQSQITTAGALYGMYCTAGVSVNLYNNFLSNFRTPVASSTSPIYGIYFSAGGVFKLFHNTIKLDPVSVGPNFGATGIYFTATPTLDLRNNIIHVNATPMGTGFVAALRKSAGVAGTPPAVANIAAASNSNIFYTPTLANSYWYAEGTSNPLLNAYNLLNDVNMNTSCANYKVFMSPRESSSFHQNNLTAVALNPPTWAPAGLSFGKSNAVATAAPAVTTDYALAVRALPADCGALQYAGPSQDAVGPTITYTPITTISDCGGLPILTATITDISGVNTAAGTKPRVYYKKSTDNNVLLANNNVSNGWKWVEATNASSPFEFQLNPALLTSAPVLGDVIQYFVVAQDNVVSPNPNVSSKQVAYASGYCPVSVDLLAGAFPTAVAPVINSMTVNAAVPYILTASASPINVCNPGTTTLSVADTVNAVGNSLPSSAFNWAPGAGIVTNPNRVVTGTNIVANTTYTVTATDPGGCTWTNTVAVALAQPFSAISVTGTTAYCNDVPNTTLTFNTTGGSSPVNTIWTGGPLVSPTVPMTIVNNTFADAYAPANWTTVHTGGGNGTTNAAGAPANIVHTGTTGPGGSYSRYQTTVTGSGTLSFSWNVVHNDPNWDGFGYYLNGTYTQLTAVSASGNTSIPVNPGDIFAFYSNAFDNFAPSFTATITNFSAPKSINVVSGNTAIVNPLPGTTIYTVTAVDPCGNTVSTTVSVTVTIPPVPTVVMATPATICPGATSNLNAISAGNQIIYYNQAVGGIPLGFAASGVNFPVTPLVTTTYYASAASQFLPSGSQTFNYTGAPQTFIVPPGVTSVTINAFGAQGFGQPGAIAPINVPGNGGRAQGLMSVVPGQTLTVYVGGQGQAPSNGWNGGGLGKGGVNGGGASDVRTGGVSLADRVIVAGGGGGAGGDSWQCLVGGGHGGGGIAVGSNFVGGGGGAGYTSGTGCGTDGGNAGGIGGSGTHGGGGGGGGLIGGGTGAVGSGPAFPGTLGQGGASFDGSSCVYTGGGGGGYYGGGGAAGNNCGAGRGGGGSSWTGTLLNPVFQGGVQTGNGQVIISWSGGTICESARVPVTVTTLAAPVVTASVNPVPACASLPITLTGTGALTYNWNPGGIALNPATIPAPLVATTYTVTGTDAGGCTATSTVAVTVNPTPNATITQSPANPLACGVIPTLTAPIGQVSPPPGARYYIRDADPWGSAAFTTGLNAVFGAGNYIATTYALATPATVFVPGTQFVYLEGSSGTEAGQTAYLAANLPLIETWVNNGGRLLINRAPNSGAATTNFGFGGVTNNYSNAQGTVNVTALDPIGAGPFVPAGYGPFTGSSYSHAHITGPGITPMITGGGYNVLCKKNWGAGMVLFGGYTAPSFHAPAPNAQNLFQNWLDYCANSAQGAPLNYLWAPNGEITQAINAPTTGIYTVTVTQGSCSSTGTISVTVNPNPVVTANPASVSVCAGSATTLSGGGDPGVTYVWSGGISDNMPFTPLATTTYTVTGTNASGCTSTATAVVTVNPVLTGTGSASPAAICLGSSTTITGAANTLCAGNITNFAGIYAPANWTNINNNSNGVVNAAGAPANIIMNSGTNNGGLPGSTNFSKSMSCSGNMTFNWSYTHADAFGSIFDYPRYTINGGAPVTFSGFIIGGSNIQSGTQTIPVNTGDNVELQMYTIDNDAISGFITLTNFSAPDAAVTGSASIWDSPSGGVLLGASPQTLTPLAAGTVTYYVEITSSGPGNCVTPTRIPVPVTVNSFANLTASASPATICIGGSSTLSSNAATNLWNPGALVGNPSVSPVATTNYTVTGTDANGCTATSTVDVVVNSNPTVTASASPAVICAGGSSTLTGGGAATYAWDPGALVGNPSVSPVATTNYTVTGTDGNGCTGTSTVDVVVNPTPTVTASASPAAICPGGSSTLTGGGAATYAWDPGALVGNPSVSPVATTNYTVTGTDANGCTGTSTVDVVVNTLPTVTASPVTQTVCENGIATISGGGAATYTWTGGITDATPFMVVAAGNYTVTGTDANGCSNTATAEVLMNAAPVITAGATPNTTCDQTTVTPSASGAGTIVWSGGLTNNVPFVAVATTTYTVTGTDGLGCSASTTVLVTVNPMSGILAPATSNQAQDHGDDFDINYYAANCDLIATVDDGAGGNVLGLTTSTVNVDATAGFHNGQPFVRRWYQITPTNNGSADVVLYINQSDFDDYNAAVALPYLPLPTSGNNADPNIGNIRITKNADAGLGNSPVVITPTANWNGTYWELSFNTPSFSQFRVHSVNPGNVPLPATVTSFSGLKLESSDKLSWTTSSEQNNAYFTLQHSTDGTNFTTIAKVNSKAQNGNSATELNYSSIHATPSLGHNYYRLQQTDLDNKLSVHAQIVDLIWGTNGSTVSIYPNPTRDILNIDLYAATAQNTTVKLLDMSGRVIKQIQAKSAVGMNNIKLSMGEIASGVYTVQVYENNQLSHTSKVKKND